MNTASLPLLSRLILWVGLACGCNQLLPAAPAPYTPDADTLHLWHFNEVQNTNTTLPALYVDDVSLQTFYRLAVTNGAKMATNLFSANLTNSLDSRGITGSSQYQAGAFGDENLHWYPDDFVGPNGEFTYEALVSPDFNPAVAGATRPPMQILSLENEGGTEARVFQFRLNSTSTNEPWRLEFQNIGSAAAASNTPATLTLIDDFSGDLSAYTSTVILDVGGTSTNTFAWEISGGSLQITTTTYDAIEQSALTRNLPLPVGQMLVCSYDPINTGSQDIGLYVGDGTPTPLVRSNYIIAYSRNNGQFGTRGFNGPTEYSQDVQNAPGISYIFIGRIDTNVFECGYYTTNGARVVQRTLTNTVGGTGSSIGFYSDVRAVGTRGNVDNLQLATNYVAVPPADPELFSALLPTNGPNAAVQGGWYHVAVTYNGLQNTANNLTLYWTALAGSPASASSLGSFRMTNDLGSASGGATIEADFTIGNEGRDAPGESFQGFVDEVRISDVVRSATGFNLNGTPYTADPNTKLLYHLDEANPADFPTNLLNDALDAVAINAVSLHVRNGASFGATAWSGAFNTALSVSGTTAGNVPNSDAAGAYANSGLAFTQFSDPTTGAFTYEALIRPDFDPNSPSEHMQIVSMEGDEGDRPFQWKFLERTNTAVPLEVQFININNGPEFLNATVPTIGPHAIVQSNWYHVAVTYNGDTNDANNLRFYWTALNSSATSANPIVVTNTTYGGTGMTADIVGTAGDFVAGNEDRVIGGNTDALIGVVDEVRISSVARAANQFLLAPPQPQIVSITPNFGAGTVTLVWTSQTETSYTIGRSLDLTLGAAGWSDVATGIAGTSPRTTNTVNLSGSSVELYRVEVE